MCCLSALPMRCEYENRVPEYKKVVKMDFRNKNNRIFAALLPRQYHFDYKKKGEVFQPLPSLFVATLLLDTISIYILSCKSISYINNLQK